MLTTHHVTGSPVWIDLNTPDVAAARDFYGGVFGWHLRRGGPEVGGYGVFDEDGRSAAGVMEVPAEQSPPSWTVYFQTPDVEATAQAVEDAGGTVDFKPMDVMDMGRMAVFSDPSGARFSTWQPGTNTGLGHAGGTGGVCWVELCTPDEKAAFDFYRSVYGWESTTMPFPDGSGSYRMANPAGEGAQAMFGGFASTANDPGEQGTAPHWLLYFGVDDCDASVEDARARGARVRVPPTDIEGVGRFAKLDDPAGAEFAVMHGVDSEG